MLPERYNTTLPEGENKSMKHRHPWLHVLPIILHTYFPLIKHALRYADYQQDTDNLS